MNNSIQQVKFLNVGHGDSSVIYLMSEEREIKHTIIIDIPDSVKLYKELDSNKVKTIDILIISHTDADHCRGLNDFIDNFTKIGNINKLCFNIDRSIPTNTLALMLKRIMEYIKRFKIVLEPGIISTETLERKILEYNGAELSIIYPDKVDEACAYLENNVNDMSVVCLLKKADLQILFTGDLGSKGWHRLLNKNDKLLCQIIKMPHHGAFYEDGENAKGLEEIIKILKPKVAIISSAQNKKYKQPDKRTIELLKSKGIEIYCTQYTQMCNGGVCEGSCECSGNICVLNQDTKYTIETEFTTSLKSSACI